MDEYCRDLMTDWVTPWIRREVGKRLRKHGVSVATRYLRGAAKRKGVELSLGDAAHFVFRLRVAEDPEKQND